MQAAGKHWVLRVLNRLRAKSCATGPYEWPVLPSSKPMYNPSCSGSRRLEMRGEHMENIISNLLKGYELGSLTRRELVQSVVMLAAATSTSSAAGFQASSIDHVSIVVSDVERSADFYQRVFGLSTLNKDPADETIRLKVGSGYLALRHRKDPGRVDHFALGVANFNKQLITRDLIQRGIAPEKEEDGDAGFHVKDPDGFRVQMTYTGNEK